MMNRRVWVLFGAVSTVACAADDADLESDTEATASATEAGLCSVTPGPWTAPAWSANVAVEAALSDALAAFTGDDLMTGAEAGTVAIAGLSDLTGPYADGDPSLASMTHPGFAPIVDAALGEFVDAIAAGNVALIDSDGAWAPGAAGGIWGDDNRGVNEGGIELRQIVDKGMFSAGGLYYHATTLTEGELDEAAIDRIAYAWGANDALDPTGELDDGANYSQQQGFHGEMAELLAAMKAYAAEPACAAERDQAARDFFVAWETSMASRFAFYMNETALALTSAATDTEFANALHELNEGIGLISGFHGMPDPASGPLAEGARLISDAQVEALLGSVGVDLGSLGDSSTGTFVESLPNYEGAVGEAEAVLSEVYAVDAAALATWRSPTPG